MDITKENSGDCVETVVRPESEGMLMKSSRANTNEMPLGILALEVGSMHRLLDPHEESGKALVEINNALETIMNGGAKRISEDGQWCFGKRNRCTKY
jgi:hypothetical protein